ncbi:hypothetical protein VM1G_03131 [Cytospora mali]|uniref:F-box domain-containing protein n=1 Tax=Cytospora mali TaxID=578113 RepID=A0A194VU09_CYTMA|nr:hypothetical protein VM1G_03131 [Valsa mali]
MWSYIERYHYCAICGGPLVSPSISQSSSKDEGGAAWHALSSYGPEVISEEDVSWTRTIHVLGFNPQARGVRKAFVMGPGFYRGNGDVMIEEEGNDPNAEDVEPFDLRCYDSINATDPVFPFHWCCYEILAKCTTGSFDVDKLDKDLLYRIMRELSPPGSTSLSNIDYGFPAPMHTRVKWISSPGYEFLVSHPRDVPGVHDIILSMFESGGFETLPCDSDLRARVRSDPFTGLPYDIVHNISTMLELGDILNLAKASWPVHVLLRDVVQFWQQHLKTSMAWFLELIELLAQDETLLQSNDPKRIVIWAEGMTRPQRWIAGPFMGVANRRRIWSVCEQLGEIYRSRPEPEGPVQTDVDKMILDYSKCSSFYAVSAPMADKIDMARNVYWLKSWAEMHSSPKELATFWDGESLAGISLTPCGVEGDAIGQERRLLGRDDTNEGIKGHFRRLEESDWITGIILHIPAITIERCREARDWNVFTSTSIQGLTAILNTGEKMLFGATERGYSQRFLSAAPNWHITGMTGITGEVDGKQQFTRLGLLQAQNPDFTDYVSRPEAAAPPGPTLLQSLLWDRDYSDLLQYNIWVHPTLRLTQADDENRRELDRDVVAHEALIWARDQHDLRSLKRLSGYILFGDTTSSLDARGDGIDIPDICGMTAEYSPESGLTRRMVGVEKNCPGPDLASEETWENFEIDGPGGEFVTEVQYGVWCRTMLRIRTNRGRECLLGDEKGLRAQSLTAPPGETLIGLMMAFSEPKGFNGPCTDLHLNLTFIGALSMPLGIPEESQPGDP